MPWWAWVLIAVGVAAVIFGVVFRRQLRFAMKVGKAMARDERLPKPLRWALGIALALKAMPAPDFGIAEGILVVCGALLLTVHRPTVRAIVAEIRAAETERLPGDKTNHPSIDPD